MEYENNAICTICGKAYHRCSTCQDSRLNPWKNVVDTMEHYKIYMTVASYNNGYLSKEKANEELLDLDLSELGTFVPEIRDKINEIMSKDIKKSIKSVETESIELKEENNE